MNLLFSSSSLVANPSPQPLIMASTRSFINDSAAVVVSNGSSGSSTVVHHSSHNLPPNNSDNYLLFQSVSQTTRKQQLPFNWTFDPMNDYVAISENIFLIVSNFFLLPAIYLALKCRYRGEAIIYSITMLSSSFYHLCDNRKIKYCILPYSTLQFLDFYSAILTLWVTAILLAPVQQRWISSFQLTGSVFFAALLQSTSVVGVWSFVVPGFCSLVLIISYWGRAYYCKGRWPSIVYSYYFYISLVLILIGSVMFASQTSDLFSIFYGFTHSAWHVCMALSITFLLPRNRRRFCSFQLNNQNNNKQELNSSQQQIAHGGSTDSVSSQERFQTRVDDEFGSQNGINCISHSDSTDAINGDFRRKNICLFNIPLNFGFDSLLRNVKPNKPMTTNGATADSAIVDIENSRRMEREEIESRNPIGIPIQPI